MNKLTLILAFTILAVSSQAYAAPKRVPELPAQTEAIADGDLIFGVDISDLTDHATGSSKKITWTQVISYLATIFQGSDADLSDLADGSLSGSKVGTGINGDNVTSGTVADARIASTIARDTEIPTVNTLGTATLACSSTQIAKYNGSAWVCAADDNTGGSTEVQDETFNATNFDGATTAGVSQDDFYDRFHLFDADDDGDFTDETWFPSTSGAPTNATYLTTSTETGLSAEANLGLLTTGLLKITVAAGVATPSTASAGTDFQAVLTNPIVAAGAQTITGAKTFDPSMLLVKGSSTGTTAFASANAGASNYTATLQAATGTVAYTSDITGTNSGTNTGDNATNTQYSELITSKTANYVYAAPNGSAGTPSFRALVAADIPALSYQAPLTNPVVQANLGTNVYTWLGTPTIGNWFSAVTGEGAFAATLLGYADAPAVFTGIKQAASESATGVIQRATTAEAVTGTNTDKAVTPAGVKAVTDQFWSAGTDGTMGIELTNNTSSYTPCTSGKYGFDFVAGVAYMCINGTNTAIPTATGMTNPMTTAGDMIKGGTAGAPTRMVPGTGVVTALEANANGTGGVATVDGTKTLTGTTIDVEGTGNAITIVDKVWFAAAGCNNTTATSFYDLPATAPAVAACIAGTNTKKGVLDFNQDTDNSGQVSLALPSDFTGAIDVKYKWLAAATSGNVVWGVQAICVADAETDDPAFNTASTATDAVKGTTLQTNDASITGVTATGCAAGELMHLRFFRDADNGSDDMTGDARLIGAEVTLRRAQ